jgi:aspartate kinase
VTSSVRVLKFGGTSVGRSPERLAAVAARVAAVRAGGADAVVVVSARGHTTDELIRDAHIASSRPDPRELDQLIATGEAASAALLAIALGDRGVPATSLLGGQAGIAVDGRHLDGRIAGIDTARLREVLRRGHVAVVAGFQGVDRAGDVTTLGRGGSDTTASALAVAIGAPTCEIYTDVTGVYTADPRVVPTARLLPRIGNGPMTELAAAGAQVLHPTSVILAGRHGVDIHVRSAFTDEPGTLVVAGRSDRPFGGALAVTYTANIARFVASRPVLGLLARLVAAGVAFDLTTPVGDRPGWGFTVATPEIDRVRRVLAGVDLAVDATVATLSLIGAGPAAPMLQVLRAAGIEPHATSTTPLRCSATIARTEIHRAVRLVHDALCLVASPARRTDEPAYA